MALRRAAVRLAAVVVEVTCQMMEGAVGGEKKAAGSFNLRNIQDAGGCRCCCSLMLLLLLLVGQLRLLESWLLLFRSAGGYAAFGAIAI